MILLPSWGQNVVKYECDPYVSDENQRDKFIIWFAMILDKCCLLMPNNSLKHPRCQMLKVSVQAQVSVGLHKWNLYIYIPSIQFPFTPWTLVSANKRQGKKQFLTKLCVNWRCFECRINVNVINYIIKVCYNDLIYMPSIMVVNFTNSLCSHN